MKTIFTLFTTSMLFIINTAQAQYCMLPGRTSYSTQQPGIKNFKLNTINRTSLPVEQPLSSPSLTVTTDTTVLRIGQTYEISITHTKDSSSQFFDTSKNNIRVWIDYNNDKDFDDAGETVVSADKKKAGVFTATFTIPAGTPIGIVRLRATAKMSQDGGHSIPTSCDMPADPIDYHGEIEDYTLRILPPLGVSNITAHSVEVAVYPNPSDGMVTVSLSSIENQPLKISLYDITGKLISTIVNESKQTADRYQLNLNNYTNANGVFFIKTSSGENTSYQKIVKTN
ncbi:MAG: T9SS type A sorting domain-containing protein [Bacteroidetes bacterium]|nr:T9SS type A sorting domain-containing protein [Bacteroidota bacterium]